MTSEVAVRGRFQQKTKIVSPLLIDDFIEAEWKSVEKYLIMCPLEPWDAKTYGKAINAFYNFGQKWTNLGARCLVTYGENKRRFWRSQYIYERFVRYLREFLQQNEQAHFKCSVDETLLASYGREWKQYLQTAARTKLILGPTCNSYIEDWDACNVYPIYFLHLLLWREIIITDIQESLVQAVLSLMKKQRDRKTIDQFYIGPAIESFIMCDSDKFAEPKSDFSLYKEAFEEIFLKDTAEYYKRESERFLYIDRKSIRDYMIYVEGCLEKEMTCVLAYLHAETASPLKKECEKTLLLDHLEPGEDPGGYNILIQGGFQVFLDEGKQEDLKRMYQLLFRASANLGRFHSRFSTHVRRAGLAAIEEVICKDDNLTAENYVQALLKVHNQYRDLVENAFNGDLNFKQALENACREFVNHNNICQVASSKKSAELLVEYIDTVLKRLISSATENKTETALEILTIFKYVEDRHVFQKRYLEDLAQRWEHAELRSESLEEDMIARLEKICTAEYIEKLRNVLSE